MRLTAVFSCLATEHLFELTFLVLLIGGVTLRSDYFTDDFISNVLAVLMPENRLACITSLTTGLRISDVLNIKTAQLKKRFSVREKKTGKLRTVYLSDELLDELLKIAGKIYVFESRTDYRKPRTRQAVYKDIKRASVAFRVPASLTLSPHTCRKIYAVKQYRRTCDISKVQALLNHSSEAVTMLYAIADTLTERHAKRKPL